MQVQESNNHIVSFDDEPLILVDADDTVVGHRSKAEAHDGMGLLHRAFSVFLFDADGAVVLQQRSAQKRLWPGFWSNTCCSHPRRGETVERAAERRIDEELALRAPLQFLYKFIYQASFGSAGTEHELCSVFVGRTADRAAVNPTEIAAIRHIAPEVLDTELVTHAAQYTPWLKLEWPRLRRDHWDRVTSLF